MRIIASSRQIASTAKVKMIRDFSSGILKQLLKVLAKEESISTGVRNQEPDLICPRPSLTLGLGLRGFFCRRNHFAGATFGFDLRLRRSTERVRADRQFAREIPIAENFYFFH